MNTKLLLLVSGLAFFTGGCSQGFKTANDLEQDERGPKACEKSCAEFGMHMSAFVLFERDHSGCVCSPGTEKAADDGATPVAAGHAVLIEARREEQQRQQQMQQQQQQQMQASGMY